MKYIDTPRKKFLLFIPRDYASSQKKKWPMIVFLHGVDERGDDLRIISDFALTKQLNVMPDFPFFVVAPLCPLRTYWDRPRPAVMVKKIIDDIGREFFIDEKRIYLTGLSMGGYGTWYIASKYPDLFAAIVPLCGAANPEIAEKIKHIPAWVFHGVKDPIVSVRKSMDIVIALKKAGHKFLRFTAYPHLEHDCWTETYANMSLYSWLLAQKKH
jgi:predicted peptidase